MTESGTATEMETVTSKDIADDQSQTAVDATVKELIETAYMKYEKCRFSEALDAVEKLLVVDPNHAQGLLLNALLLEQMEREEESQAIYEKVLDNHPEFSQAYREFGRFLLLRENTLGAAESYLLRGLTKNPQDPLAHALLAEVYVRTDRKQQAFLHLKIAVRYTTEDHRYFETCAKVLSNLEEEEEVRLLSRILVSHMNDRGVRIRFKRALRAQKKERRGFTRYLKKVLP
ncbi:hypothetical protein GXN76_12720 [Kroppenstedtia pulmonis]|uniref:Uncharacterized protein n=1 Tax=Kroppenstedtia pulmonis TaxID=1380685 RepID=A0A7D4BX29_9BACL|nr:hypothetical protein [Kroppenstedtia pulmonis]QKG85253.1 hypothetical protein GXN76_12720 [Kroppenstedtia pulmonis]